MSLPARERGGRGLNLYGKGTLLKVLKIVILLISGLNGFLQGQVGANEGGGKIILGINDKMPRRVVGCQAFNQLERTKAGLIDRLRLRIEGEP